MRARDVDAPAPQHPRDRLLVGRVQVGVQEAHGHRVDAVGDARDVVAPAAAPSRGRARRGGRPPRVAARAARAARDGRATRVVERRPGLAGDLDHVGEAARRDECDRRAAPLAAARSSRRSCRARAARDAPRRAARPPLATAVAGAAGVDGTFTIRPSSATRSVNVPPVSTPTRIGGVSHRTPVRCAEWVPRPRRAPSPTCSVASTRSSTRR